MRYEWARSTLGQRKLLLSGVMADFAAATGDRQLERPDRRLAACGRAGDFLSAGGLATKAKESAQQRIDTQVLSNETVEEFPATVRATRDGSTLEVEIVVDAKHLPFAEKSGRRVQELTFVTVVRDAGGKYVDGTQTVMDLAVTPEKFANCG